MESDCFVVLISKSAFNTEAKRDCGTHCDLSVEITDAKTQLKTWSEMWFSLLEKLHRLSIKILMEKVKWDKYLSRDPILGNLMSIKTFQSTPFWCPFFPKNFTVNNAETIKYLPKRGPFLAVYNAWLDSLMRSENASFEYDEKLDMNRFRNTFFLSANKSKKTQVKVSNNELEIQRFGEINEQEQPWYFVDFPNCRFLKYGCPLESYHFIHIRFYTHY